MSGLPKLCSSVNLAAKFWYCVSRAEAPPRTHVSRARPGGRKGYSMKHSVVTSGLRGGDIRPPQLFSEFRRLSIEDAAAFFADGDALVDVGCPACGGVEKQATFEKNGFNYNKCISCQSLFVSPRPTREALARYYSGSRASRFRAEHFTKATQEVRRLFVLRSHASWLGRLFEEAGTTSSRALADLGTNFPTIFEELKLLDLFDSFYSIRPNPDLADACREHGTTVTDAPVEKVGTVTAFERMECWFAPHERLRSAWEMLAPGGLLVFTTRTSSGFDLQMLWDRTPYIFVPEHLNLLSVDGITRLVERSGFELVELSTPGQLDVELVQLAVEEDTSIVLPPFVATLLRDRGAEAHQDFQEFLQKHRLSSHVRVATVKK